MKLPKSFGFTQSNLKDYIDCPYRFYLKYIVGIKWPALLVEDAVEFELQGQTGARFHRLVQQYLLGIPETRLTEIAENDLNPEIIQWWKNFLTDIPPRLEGRRYVETSLSTQLLGHRLLAKYDLILLHQANLIIFDWKTSSKRPRKEWLLERVQTRIYRYLLTLAGHSLGAFDHIDPEQVSMNYWFAPHPDSFFALPYDQKTFETDEVFLKNYIQKVLDQKEDHFFRTDDLRKCKFCLYRSHCDRGIRAGDLAFFEDFELDTGDFLMDLDLDDIEEIKF